MVALISSTMHTPEGGKLGRSDAKLVAGTSTKESLLASGRVRNDCTGAVSTRGERTNDTKMGGVPARCPRWAYPVP